MAKEVLSSSSLKESMASFQIEGTKPGATSLLGSFASDLGIRQSLIVVEDIPEGGIVSTKVIIAAVANCTNTVLGAGTLAVPAAMSLAGLAVYEVMLVGIFTATFISLRWLIAVTDEIPEGMQCNYEGVSGRYLPKVMTIAITGAFMVAMFALSMSYLLFISTSLEPLLDALLKIEEEKVWGINRHDVLRTGIMLTIALLVVLPLSLLRDISSLKASSIVGTFTLLYSSVYVIYSGFSHIASEGPSESFQMVNLSGDTVVCAAMTCSAFSCHISTMPIYKSLGSARRPATMILIVALSLSLAAVFYQAVGIAGYMRFGSGVKGNVLQSLGDNEPLTFAMGLANCGVPANLMASMPLVVWPLRSCSIAAFRSVTSRDLVADPSDKEWRLSTCILLALVLTAATLVPDITTVMGLGGAVGTAFIVFVYPSAFYLAVVKQVTASEWCHRRHWPQLAMMALGAVAGAVGFGVAFSRLIRGGSQSDSNQILNVTSNHTT